jgi:hypothetical protein
MKSLSIFFLLISQISLGSGFDYNQNCAIVVVIKDEKYFDNSRDVTAWCKSKHNQYGFDRGCTISNYEDGLWKGLFEWRGGFSGVDSFSQYLAWSKSRMFLGIPVKVELHYGTYCKDDFSN